MPLPTLNVNITALAEPENGSRASGTFAKGNGFPAWAQLNEQGDIDVTGAPDQGPPDGAKVSVAFTLELGDSSTLQFASTGGFIPPTGNSDFGTPSVTNGGKTLTVSDTNAEARFTQLEYGLKFSDNSTLDPRMINR